MFAGICFFFFGFALYTTIAHVTDSQALFVSHTLQLFGNGYSLSPCKIVCLASVYKHTMRRMPYNTSCKLALTYLSLFWITTEIELNPAPSFPCGSCGVEVLDDDPILVTVANVGTTSSARAYQLELISLYKLVTCLSRR